MDFSIENDLERKYFEQDFSVMNELMKRIRSGLVNGNSINISDLSFDGILDFKPSKTLVYITLYQKGQKFIRYAACEARLWKR